MENEWMDEIAALVDETRDVIVCSIDDDGCPNAKAMFKMEHEGLKVFYFSTNTSARRTQQFLKCPKASLYFCGHEQVNGLMLVGDMQVCQDHENKARLWREGSEIYYPLGVDDPDYSVLKFTARSGNYYHALQNHSFAVE